MEPVFVIKRSRDGQYYTGRFDEYNPDLNEAKFFSASEREISFCFRDEEWVLVPYTSIEEGKAQ